MAQTSRLEHFALMAAFILASSAVAVAQPHWDEPIPIVRGHRLSGAVRYQAKRSPGGGGGSTVSPCSTPGSTNYKTNCRGKGRPVNETWIATKPANPLMLVAGANDYNSYNGQGQNGYYWSTNGGSSWNDAGPIDVFPHNPNYGAGDPGLAIDANGVVYYSSLFFSFATCKVGGVELLRRATNGSWSYYQIAANSNSRFQDKPAIAIDASHVYVSWTQFQSCSGINVPSPIRVAVFQSGAQSVAPSANFALPGSTYSQGSSIAADGSGGFWIAWEEFPSSSASVGAIRLSHCMGPSASSCPQTPQTISPPDFQDLPSPLPGFAFRTDSFPALTLSGGSPQVVWTSYNSTAQRGRAYRWSQGTVQAIANTDGDDQFFPAIAPSGSGGVFVSFSQTNRNDGTYEQYLWNGTSVSKVSTALSVPDSDAFFSGEFIGDYNGLAVSAGVPHPTWTDIRGPNPNYPGYEMDAMSYSP